MDSFKIGDIVKVQVVGFQNYGIFVKSIDDESYMGLIHISEVSNEFVRDISKVCSINDIIYAKVLDVDTNTKHIKLSIKACAPRTRYRSSIYHGSKESEVKENFEPLQENLNEWIQQQLREKRNHDQG